MLASLTPQTTTVKTNKRQRVPKTKIEKWKPVQANMGEAEQAVGKPTLMREAYQTVGIPTNIGQAHQAVGMPKHTRTES